MLELFSLVVGCIGCFVGCFTSISSDGCELLKHSPLKSLFGFTEIEPSSAEHFPLKSLFAFGLRPIRGLFSLE